MAGVHNPNAARAKRPWVATDKVRLLRQNSRYGSVVGAPLYFDRDGCCGKPPRREYPGLVSPTKTGRPPPSISQTETDARLVLLPKFPMSPSS